MAHCSKIAIAGALAGALAALSACSDTSACCVDDYPPAYALLYGTVRGASGQPAAGVLVRAGDGTGVVTDGTGRYRLSTLLHGMGTGTLSIDVAAYRTDAARGLVDSTRVRASVPFFAGQPPPDSTRVDLVVGWAP